MTETESTNSNNDAYEQLVAYLDGELDADSSQQVERRLTEDSSYRRELQQLQRAWDMLDELPKAEVSESFTQTTVEMVVLSAEMGLKETRGRENRRSRALWALAGASVILAALGSYGLFSKVLARSNEQLARDLPVIENIELYSVADSVEFLRQLDQEGMFDEEVDDAL